jgi:hypothetical protein
MRPMRDSRQKANTRWTFRRNRLLTDTHRLLWRHYPLLCTVWPISHSASYLRCSWATIRKVPFSMPLILFCNTFQHLSLILMTAPFIINYRIILTKLRGRKFDIIKSAQKKSSKSSSIALPTIFASGFAFSFSCLSGANVMFSFLTQGSIFFYSASFGSRVIWLIVSGTSQKSSSICLFFFDGESNFVSSSSLFSNVSRRSFTVECN